MINGGTPSFGLMIPGRLQKSIHILQVDVHPVNSPFQKISIHFWWWRFMFIILYPRNPRNPRVSGDASNFQQHYCFTINWVPFFGPDSQDCSKDSYVLLRQANITHHIGHSAAGARGWLNFDSQNLWGPPVRCFFETREYWFVQGI